MKDTEDMGAFDRAIHEIDRLTVEPARHLSVQMDDLMKNAVRAASTSGQAASVTVKIVVKRKGEQVELSGNVTAKLPKPAASTVMLYPDDEGDLFNHNPMHTASALPGVDVRTPPRRKPADPRAVEVPINAKGKE